MIKGIVPQLSEAGKIKIGGLGEARQKKGGGSYRLPVKYDYFVLTTTRRTPEGDLEIDAALMSELSPVVVNANTGEVTRSPLREIPIVVHSDDIEEVFPTALAMYVGKKLACRGDGAEAIRYQIIDGKRTGESKIRACPCEEYTGPKKRCKPHGILHCSIRAPGRAVAGSVHKWRTTSQISISRMAGSLEQIRAMAGVLQGLPLVLKIEEVEVSPDGVGSSKVYCCHVELRAQDIGLLQQQALDAARMRAELGTSRTAYRAMISAPADDDETEDEAAEAAAEFHESASNSAVDVVDAKAEPPASESPSATEAAALPVIGAGELKTVEATKS